MPTPEQPAPEAPPLSPVLQRLQAHFGEAILETHSQFGDDTVILPRERLIEALRLLRDTPELAFEMLVDVTAVDYLTYHQPGATISIGGTSPSGLLLPEGHETVPAPADRHTLSDAIAAGRTLPGPRKGRERFEVVYHLHSLTHGHRVRIKVPVPAGQPEVDSAAGLWKTADWLEREAWDMYGISFHGHPNLKRLLNHFEFVGHPLRKDYPLKKRQPIAANDPLWDEMERRLQLKKLK